MRKLYYILIILIVISCKDQLSKKAVKTSNNTKISVPKAKKDKQELKQLEDCYDYLTELVRSSNFPFKYWDINPNKVNLIIDQDNGNLIQAKLFFETDGTGTIGWIEYNIKERSLLNTSANLEQPEKLSFDLKWALSLEKCLGITVENTSQPINVNFSQIYTSLKEIPLPQKYSYEFISDDKDFISLSNQLYGVFKLEDVDNYKIAKLPVYENFFPILLEVSQPSGQSELYLVILNKSFKMIDKIIIYTSQEMNSGNLSTTYEISKDYQIKIKNALLIGDGGKVKELNKKLKNYSVSDEGKIIESD